MNNERIIESPCTIMANDKVTRVLRKIDEKDILDIEKYNILPIGTDEIFVKIKDNNTHYISNYGRCIRITDKAKLLTGNINQNGRITYQISTWVNNEKIWKNVSADRLVVENFFECMLTGRTEFIWHSGYNLEDNYYKNLYVMELKPYKILKAFVEKGGIDTEEKILEIANTKASYEPTVLGVGYWGMTDVDVFHWTYVKWVNMLTRCYSEAFHKVQPNYIGCTVCEEWHNYSNFKKWCEENYYSVDDEKMELDKDILKKRNKMYSPETCIFVPKSVNSLFINAKSARGNLPIGIDIAKNGSFRVRVRKLGKSRQSLIGCYDNIVEAFEVYKENKEQLIKETAHKYKDKIPEKLYNAMMNWEVEYDD